MPDQPPITLQLEIPPEVNQRDVWEFEEHLNQIAGITTDLQEPKNIFAVTLLLIQIAAPYIGQVVTVAGGINIIHDLAENIHTFLHSRKQEDEPQPGRNKVVIITKGKRIELYNLSSKEIEKIIAQ